MFKKFIDKLFGNKEEVEEVVEEKLEIAKEVSEEVKEAVEEKLETAKETSEEVEEIVEEKLDTAKETSEEVKEVVEEKLETAKETSEEVKEVVEEKLDTAKEVSEEVKAVVEEKLDTAKETSEEAKEVVEEKLETAKEVSEEVKEVVEEKLETAKETSEEVKEVVEEKPKKLGFFEKLKKGLSKTRDNFTEQISSIIKSYQKVDGELFEELEEVLITADVGIETTMDLIDNLRDRVKEEKVTDPEEVMGLLKSEIEKLMVREDLNYNMKVETSPAVILVVGVNGVGKTTTIGKMAARYKNEGKKVLVAAGDTFRAAAIEQLEEWGNRAGVDIISHNEGSDPAAVIFDGIQAAKARKTEILICDTAGRLHNKANLMNELSKISRVLENEYPEAEKEVLLVLDATTGQNAMSQAKVFKEAANITAIALTKLDGTAKGGVVIALQAELGVPIKFVGIGEGVEDLQAFNAKDFIDAIFEE